MSSSSILSSLFLLASLSVSSLSSGRPNIDWSALGPVALLGSYSGLRLFNQSDSAPQPNVSASFSDSFSRLISIDLTSPSSSDSVPSVRTLAQTDSHGQILSLCHSLQSDSLFIGGRFDSINSVQRTRNIAKLDLSQNVILPIADGLDGPVHDIDCSREDQIFISGQFSNPSSSGVKNLVIWNNLNSAWVSFDRQPVLDSSSLDQLSYLTSPSGESLIVSGDFDLLIQANSTVLTDTPSLSNSPSASSSDLNPFAIGSSLQPIPLSSSSTVTGSPSNPAHGYHSPNQIFCPSGADGPGSSWQLDPAFDNGLLTVNLGRSVQAGGIRLGNSFADGGGTAGFHVVSLPDNQVMNMTFLNPVTNQLDRCQLNCTLSRDLKIAFQDFIFSSSVTLSGIQLVITSKYGNVAGLHLLNLLSTGNTVYADNLLNDQSAPPGKEGNGLNSHICRSGIGSVQGSNSVESTGSWSTASAHSSIPSIPQSVRVANASPGTTPQSGPSLTWSVWVPQTGAYELWFNSPGCLKMADCPARTEISISVDPPGGSSPNSTTFNAHNQEDQAILIYNGTFNGHTQVPITLRLAKTVSGSNPVKLVADQITLRSLQVDQFANMNVTGLLVHGIYEFVLSGTGAFGQGSTPTPSTAAASTQFITAVDRMGIRFTSGSPVSAVASDDKTVFAASRVNPTLSVLGATTMAVPNGGFNGPVNTLLAINGTLYAGGQFTSTADGTVTGLDGLAKWYYQSPNSVWTQFGGPSAVGSPVHLITSIDQKLYVLGTSDGSRDLKAVGVFDPKNSTWLGSNLGFYVGNLTALAAKPTKPSRIFVAGNLFAIADLDAPSAAFLSTPPAGSQASLPKVRGFQFQMNQTASQIDAAQANRSSLAARSIGLSSRGPSSPLVARSLPNAPSSPSLSFPTLSSRQVRSAGGIGETLNVSLPYALTGTTLGTILTGAFWKDDTLLIGGRFVTTNSVKNVGIYNFKSQNLNPLNGTRTLEGEVLTINVVGDLAWIGGSFVSPSGRLGLDTYNLATGSWATRTMAGLGPYPNTNVSVRTIRSRDSGDVIVGGKFQQLGSLPCQSICLWSSQSSQWTNLGNGLRGVVNQMVLLGQKNTERLVAVGRFQLNSTVGDVSVARWNFDGSQAGWLGIGDQSVIPGPVRSIAVGERGLHEEDGMFVGGDLDGEDGSFLMNWNGTHWLSVAGLAAGSRIEEVQFVPVRNPSTSVSIANGVKSDRMLMVSGSISLQGHDGNLIYGSVMYDGSNWYPYLQSLNSSGKDGIISRLISMTGGFKSAIRRIHSVAQVIAVSMAISFGIVALGVLIGTLLGLRKRRKERNAGSYSETLAGNETSPKEDEHEHGIERTRGRRPTLSMMVEDDSRRRRPTSLLATIDAATAGMIQMKSGGTTPELEDDPRSPEALFTTKAREANATESQQMVPGAERGPEDGDRDAGHKGAPPQDMFASQVDGEEYVEVGEEDEDEGIADDDGIEQIDIRRARWSFEPQLPGEIGVGAGESVEVRDRSNQEWWLVKRSDGVEGVVPADWFL